MKSFFAFPAVRNFLHLAFPAYTHNRARPLISPQERPMRPKTHYVKTMAEFSNIIFCFVRVQFRNFYLVLDSVF